MAKNQIIEFDSTAANNTDVGGIGIQGTNLVSNFDDAFRYLMKAMSDAVTRHVAKAAGSYTPVKTDHNQLWRCTGAVTLTLTAAATLTTGWCLWVRANGGAVTIDPNGAETIDGAATKVIPDGQECLIICDGTTFFTMFVTGLITGSSSIASAATTDLSTTAGNYITITGTNTITALGTMPAGVVKVLKFNGILTFTHNATSLILPGAVNITTAAGDVAVMVSEGSGNWRCLAFSGANGVQFPVATAPAPTREGAAQWDSDDDVLRVGNGSTTTQIGIAQSATSTATGGTSIDFTGIPAGAKRITISIAGLSTSGTNDPFLQIGDSGGIETSGYSGSRALLQNAGAVGVANSTAAFLWGGTLAANVYSGILTLTLVDPSNNTWAYSGVIGTTTTLTFVSGGSKATSAVLDRVRLTTNGGTDTFDANAGVSIQVE